MATGSKLAVVARPSSSSSEIWVEEVPGILTPTNMAFGFEVWASIWIVSTNFMSQKDYSLYLDEKGMHFVEIKMKEKIEEIGELSGRGFFQLF